jgi:hypothetical protein
VEKHFSQVPEQNDWQEFKPLFGGGKIKICDTLRAVTPFGGCQFSLSFRANWAGGEYPQRSIAELQF